MVRLTTDKWADDPALKTIRKRVPAYCEGCQQSQGYNARLTFSPARGYLCPDCTSRPIYTGSHLRRGLEGRRYRFTNGRKIPALRPEEV